MSHSGWIVKEGGRYKSWKKRFAVIEGHNLAYYKKENKKDLCGEVNLKVAADIQPVEYKSKKFCFQIVTPERTYHICAISESDMRSWCEKLRAQQGSANGKRETGATSGLASSGSKPNLSSSPAPAAAPAGPVAASAGPMSSGSSSNLAVNDPFKGDNEKSATGTKVGVDDFDLLKVVGKGSFGKVMLVRKRDTGKVYAMKVLNKRTIIERNEVEHTKNEKAILMKLEHPFLVRLHFSFQSPDKLYFIMDYVNGGELFFHLQKERRFTEDRVRIYAAEIAAGLEYLHAQGVIYRDLKPENLLLTAEGHVIMTDFGLSKEGLQNTEDRTSTFCGTPEYLAPEILEGKGYGKGVDWWSFGTLIFEMMTGLPPFYCEDVQQMYNKIMTAQLTIPDTMSPEAGDLIRKLLERDPEKRLSDPEQLKRHAFFAPINWADLMAKRIPPPFIPEVRDELDTQNIDPTFTEEAPTLSDDDDEGTVDTTADGGFDGFTYVPK